MLVVRQAGLELARTSTGSRELLCLAGFAGHFRQFPFWAIFTPDAALIFINHSTEKLGVL